MKFRRHKHQPTPPNEETAMSTNTTSRPINDVLTEFVASDAVQYALTVAEAGHRGEAEVRLRDAASVWHRGYTPAADWRQVFTPEQADRLVEWVDGLPANAGVREFYHVAYDDGECRDDCPACSLLDLIASRGAVGP